MDRLQNYISGRTELDPLEQSFATSWLQRILTRDFSDHILDRAAQTIALLEAFHARPAMALSGHRLANRDCHELPGSFGPITVKVNDGHMGNDVHATGFCTWSSAIYLAKYMAEHPNLPRAVDEQPLRLLELGSGTGYAGIAVAKLLQDRGVRSVVTLSDYDDATLERLRDNVASNGLSDEHGALVRVLTSKLDWNDLGVMQEVEFEIVLAADTVYEPTHGQLLHDVIRKVLHPAGAFHAVVPHRPTHSADIEAFERAFRSGDSRPASERRPIIAYNETLHVEDDEPLDYVYYRIEWPS